MGVYFGTTEITGLYFGDTEITGLYFGDTEIWAAWAEYDGTLPAQYTANGDYLADYRIYGSAGGVGDYVAPEYKQVHTDTVTIDGIVWDILGYDHDTVYKSDNTIAQHSVTIQAHDVLLDMQFDAKEALFAFDSGLSAGTYHFTVGAQPWHASDVGKTMQFTLAQALPAGGQLVINNAYNATMVGATISAFASGTATTATETVTMSEGSDGVDLGAITTQLSQDGVINSIQRAFLGSNNWQESGIRQYLNSSASAGSVWSPQTKWNRPPSWVTNTAGFLSSMSADFIANLGTTNKTTTLNNVTDGGGTGTTLDKVFLISRSEVYAGDETTGGDGTAYSYYSDFSDLSAPGTGADGNRIKSRNGAKKYWWLRSPLASSASNARTVDPSGTLNYSSASNTHAVAPACCIPLDDIETNAWLREKFLKNPSAAYGYEVDMSVSDGTTSTTTPIYIGSSPLGEDEYVDYGEQKVYRRTEQLFNAETAVYKNDIYKNDSGVEAGYPGTGYYETYIPITPNETIYVIGVHGSLILTIRLYFYDAQKQWIRRTGGYTEDFSVVTPSNAAYAQLQISSQFIPSPNTIMITQGSAAPSTYIPYLQPTDPPVPLPALPTVDGMTITDYAGQSAAVPSRFTAKISEGGILSEFRNKNS